MTKPWLKNESQKEFHVVPTNDIREHYDKKNCWCEPRQSEKHPDVWVHRVFSKEYPECERELGS